MAVISVFTLVFALVFTLLFMVFHFSFFFFQIQYGIDNCGWQWGAPPLNIQFVKYIQTCNSNSGEKFYSMRL